MRKVTLLALLLCSATLPAQSRRPMTFEDALTLSNLSQAQLSPDGRHVAYVVESINLSGNTTDTDVWVAPADGSGARRLTTSPKKDRSPRWSPDGQRLAFISEREGAPQLFLLSPFGGEAEQLTTAKSGVIDFRWAPDGRRIAFVSPQAPTEEEEKRVKGGDDAVTVDLNLKHTRLWLITVATKEARELVAREFDVLDPQWSPDGSRIAFQSVPSTRADDNHRSDIWVVDVASGAPKRITENQGADNAPRWSPDGGTIAFLTRSATAPMISQTQLAVIPAQGGAPRTLNTGAFLYQPGSPTWSADGKTLWFTAGTGTTSQLFSLPITGGTPRQVTTFEGTMGGFFGFEGVSFSTDGSRFASINSTLTQAPEVAVFESANPATPRIVSAHNGQVAQWSLGQSEVMRWKSADGLEVEGILVYPVGYERGKKYPMMTVVHGGPSGVWMQMFSSSWYDNSAHVWAGKGWAVFYPNPRGSSGYGDKFMLANVKDWGGGDYRDIQTGIDELVRRGVADPERLAQSGWSYGGYMTAWTLTQTNRFKAVMVGAGLTNMFSMYSTNDLQTLLESYFQGEPWDVKQQYERASAMTYIKNAKTPTLILHGQVDTRVPVGQAQELYMGLKKNDVPVELVFFPREPHGLQEPRHMVDKLQREYAFFARYVLGEGAKVVP